MKFFVTNVSQTIATLQNVYNRQLHMVAFRSNFNRHVEVSVVSIQKSAKCNTIIMSTLSCIITQEHEFGQVITKKRHKQVLQYPPTQLEQYHRSLRELDTTRVVNLGEVWRRQHLISGQLTLKDPRKGIIYRIYAPGGD